MTPEKTIAALSELGVLVRDAEARMGRDELKQLRLSPSMMDLVIGQLPDRYVAEHMLFMVDEAIRFVREGRIEKAMRWLGFLQGVAWMRGYASLDDLKKMNMPEGT